MKEGCFNNKLDIFSWYLLSLFLRWKNADIMSTIIISHHDLSTQYTTTWTIQDRCNLSSPPQVVANHAIKPCLTSSWYTKLIFPWNLTLWEEGAVFCAGRRAAAAAARIFQIPIGEKREETYSSSQNATNLESTQYQVRAEFTNKDRGTGQVTAHPATEEGTHRIQTCWRQPL